MATDLGARRLTSDRNDVLNDTDRVAYCGPYVIAAITGFAISNVETEIQRFRQHDREGAREQRVKGTDAEEVTAALASYGFEMRRIADFMDRPRKERPSVWAWMQMPRNAWSHYILAVHKGNQGHWILIKGVKLCDTYSEGKWQFVCDGPHKGAKIMEVFEVKRALV
jgi:hypothetical protein